MQKCISKEHLDCVYLTKESRDEVLKILEPLLGKDDYVSIVEEDDKVVVFHFKWRHKAHYYYNHWYVRVDGDEFYPFTEDEFRNMFELVET